MAFVFTEFINLGEIDPLVNVLSLATERPYQSLGVIEGWGQYTIHNLRIRIAQPVYCHLFDLIAFGIKTGDGNAFVLIPVPSAHQHIETTNLRCFSHLDDL